MFAENTIHIFGTVLFLGNKLFKFSFIGVK